MNDISLGLQLMQYGLAGVFMVLILFYVLITLLVKIFPYRSENEEKK